MIGHQFPRAKACGSRMLAGPVAGNASTPATPIAVRGGLGAALAAALAIYMAHARASPG